jgi:hypothetical protein
LLGKRRKKTSGKANPRRQAAQEEAEVTIGGMRR